MNAGALMETALEKFSWTLIVLLSVLLVYGGGTLLFQADALDVPELKSHEFEIAWLQSASASSSWERLISCGRLFAGHPDPWVRELQIQIGDKSFPRQSASVPSFELFHPQSPYRVIVRWYKITSEVNEDAWVQRILKRKKIPSVVVGGATTDEALALSRSLAEHTGAIDEPRRPILALTTASANLLPSSPRGLLIPATPDEVSLLDIYPRKTFRFGFDNQAISDGLIRVLWSVHGLKPQPEALKFVVWEDDAYARDFVGAFWQGLVRKSAMEQVGVWLWAQSQYLQNLFPLPGFQGVFPLDLAGHKKNSFRLQMFPTPQIIDSSVGTRDALNRFEQNTLGYLLADLGPESRLKQGLLVLGGQAIPSRRFLRELHNYRPDLGKSLVVVAGDTFSLDMFYRDRQITWPVAELPFRVMFFSHADPVSTEAGFAPLGSSQALEEPSRTGSTEDVVLNAQILESLLISLMHPDCSPMGVAQSLAKVRWQDHGVSIQGGSLLFDASGNRNRGTGENFGILLPGTRGGGSKIEIWTMVSPGGFQGATLVPSKVLMVPDGDVR